MIPFSHLSKRENARRRAKSGFEQCKCLAISQTYIVKTKQLVIRTGSREEKFEINLHRALCSTFSRFYLIRHCSPQLSRIHAEGIHRHVQTFFLEFRHTILQLVPQQSHVPSIRRVAPQNLVVEHLSRIVIPAHSSSQPPWIMGGVKLTPSTRRLCRHMQFHYSGSLFQMNFSWFMKDAPSVCQHSKCALDHHSETGVVEREQKETLPETTSHDCASQSRKRKHLCVMSSNRVVEANEYKPAACGKKPRRMLCAHVSGRVVKKLITFLCLPHIGKD